MEYHKNLDLNDIVYFCEYDLIWKTEQWKDIDGYEGIYEISDLGRVKSLERLIENKTRSNFKMKNKILKVGINNNGYYFIVLCMNSIPKTRTIHQLVAIAFLNHAPCSFELVINHKNFIRTDSKAKNLEITNQRENTNKKHIISTSKYTGVCWDKKANKWKSGIRINSKIKHLGYFTNEIDASKAYDEAKHKIYHFNDVTLY